MVRRETDKNGKRHPGQIIYGQNSGEDWPEVPSRGRSTNGQLKNQSLVMLEDDEESMSLTSRTRSSMKPVRMQEEDWKHQWLQPCFARHARKTSMERPVARLLISSLNLCVSWKPVNPQECKNLYQNVMKTILGRGDNSLRHCNLVHKFVPMPQAMKIPAVKVAVDREWEKFGKIPAWVITKVRNKSDVIDETRTKDIKVHFASLMDICHLKNAELETRPKTQRSSRTLR